MRILFVFLIFSLSSAVHAEQVGDMTADGQVGLEEAIIALQVTAGIVPGASLGQYTRTYIDNGDGTLTASATNLMWQQADDGSLRNWSAAGTYCTDLPLAGHNDWRLPTKEELEGLVRCSSGTKTPLAYGETCGNGSAIPSIDSSFSCRSDNFYWSSTTVGEGAWFIFFNGGISAYGSQVNNNCYVRCVR